MPDMDINIANPKLETTGSPPPKRRRYFFMILLLVGAVFFSCKLLYTTKLTTIGGSTLSPRERPWLVAVKQFFFHANPTITGFSEDHINILVLGIGGPGHDGPYLSDTNILASIKPSTKEVALLSIPRDLGVPVKNHGWRKINSASAFGEAERPGAGGDYAREVFADVFKTNIPYYVRVDFTAFQEIVDAVGGIEIDVPNSFTDASFPAENNAYQTVHFDAGAQIMGGVRALIYARSRHGDNGEGSDFARSRRQEQVMLALKQKVLSLGTLTNPAKLAAVYQSITSHIATNLSLDQLLYLTNLTRDVQKPHTVVFDSSPNGFLINSTGENGAFILSPKTGNFDTMIAAIQNIFMSSSTLITTPVATNITASTAPTEFAKLEIQNGTWRVGLAAKWEETMRATGFPVIRIGNSLQRPVDKTVVYILNPKTPSSAIKSASRLTNAPFSTVLPDWLKVSYDNPTTPESETGMKYNTDADLLIVLGTDAKE